VAPFFPRADRELMEPLSFLEQVHIDCNYDDDKAWAKLDAHAFQFIAGETARCQKDITYYLRNYHFIRRKDVDGSVTTLYPMWATQEAVIDEMLSQQKAGRPVRIIVLKGRQAGITTLGTSILCWMTFFFPNRYVLAMSDELDKVSANFTMARTAYTMLPWWMKPAKRYDRESDVLGFDRPKDQSTGGRVGLDSRIMFEAANKPTGAAYSKALFAAHLAEIGRYKQPKPITEGVFGSLIGAPNTFGFLEGTAQGRNTLFHRLWTQALDGGFWKPVFIPWYKEPGYTFPVPEGFERTDEEKARAESVHELTGDVLTDGQFMWYRNKKAEFDAAGDDTHMPQEFPYDQGEAWIASGESIFPKKALADQIKHFVRSPKWRGHITYDMDKKDYNLSPDDHGEFQVWEYYRRGGKYVVAADTAIGVESGDFSACQVVFVPDRITEPLRQAAVWHGKPTPQEFARIIAAIGYMYGEALLAPEINMVNSVVSDLMQHIQYPNIYRMVNEKASFGRPVQYLGWMTTSRNKNNMIGNLRELLLQYDVIIKHDKTVDELLDYVRTDRFGHTFGPSSTTGHDDLCMSFMIACQVAALDGSRIRQEEEEKKEQGVGNPQQVDVDEAQLPGFQASDEEPAFDCL